MAGFFELLNNPRYLSAVAGGMQAFGQFAFGQSQIENGQQARELAEFQAQQLQQQAGDAQASAQRQAFSEERRTKYLMSDMLAKAAASGGGASDPTVVNLIAQTATEGAYRQQVALYNGDARAQQLRLQAETRQYEGQAQEAEAARTGRVNMLGAVPSLLRTYARDSSIYQRFGGGGPKSPGDLVRFEE